MDRQWNEVLFFPGEDAEAIKTRFVEVWAHHKNNSPYEIAQYVFRDLKEPTLRAGQAAQIWGNDIELKERVRLLILKGPPVPDASQNELLRRTLGVSDDPCTSPKDKIAAIRLAAELQGFIKKSVETKITGSSDNGGTDFLAALAARLPT